MPTSATANVLRSSTRSAKRFVLADFGREVVECLADDAAPEREHANHENGTDGDRDGLDQDGQMSAVPNSTGDGGVC